MRIRARSIFMLVALAGLPVSAALAAPADARTVTRPSELDLQPVSSDYTPDSLYAVEASVLGASHAREHLAQRNLTKRLAAQGKLGLLIATPTVTGTPAQIGEWSAAFIPPGSSAEAIGVQIGRAHV